MLDAIGELLPAAVAVALSPIPIVAVVLVLGTPRARVNGAAFATGWVVGLAAVALLVVLVLGTDPGEGTESGIGWGKLALGAGLLALAARTWRKRPRGGERAELPAWMDSLDELTPGRATGLGAALSALNPKNLALTLAAAASISQAGIDRGEQVIAVLVFVLVGSLSVAGSVLFYLLDAQRARPLLASLRGFMAANNATIMFVILLLLGAKLIGDGLGGV